MPVTCKLKSAELEKTYTESSVIQIMFLPFFSKKFRMTT